MDKVKIKRVKRHSKHLTTQEKIVAGIGLGSTLMGGAGAVSANTPNNQIVRTQDQNTGSTSTVKDTLRKIFGATFGAKQAKADEVTPGTAMTDMNGNTMYYTGTGWTTNAPTTWGNAYVPNDLTTQAAVNAYQADVMQQYQSTVMNPVEYGSNNLTAPTTAVQAAANKANAGGQPVPVVDANGYTVGYVMRDMMGNLSWMTPSGTVYSGLNASTGQVAGGGVVTGAGFVMGGQLPTTMLDTRNHNNLTDSSAATTVNLATNVDPLAGIGTPAAAPGASLTTVAATPPPPTNTIPPNTILQTITHTADSDGAQAREFVQNAANSDPSQSFISKWNSLSPTAQNAVITYYSDPNNIPTKFPNDSFIAYALSLGNYAADGAAVINGNTYVLVNGQWQFNVPGSQFVNQPVTMAAPTGTAAPQDRQVTQRQTTTASGRDVSQMPASGTNGVGMPNQKGDIVVWDSSLGAWRDPKAGDTFRDGAGIQYSFGYMDFQNGLRPLPLANQTVFYSPSTGQVYGYSNGQPPPSGVPADVAVYKTDGKGGATFYNAAFAAGTTSQVNYQNINLLAPGNSFGIQDIGTLDILKTHPDWAQGQVGFTYVTDANGQIKKDAQGNFVIASITISGKAYTPQQLADTIETLGSRVVGVTHVADPKNADAYSATINNMTQEERQIWFLGTAALATPGVPYVNTATNVYNAMASGTYAFSAPTTATVNSPYATEGMPNQGVNPMFFSTTGQAQAALDATNAWLKAQGLPPNATLVDMTVGTAGGTFVTQYNGDQRRPWSIVYTNTQGRQVMLDVGDVVNRIGTNGTLTSAPTPSILTSTIPSSQTTTIAAPTNLTPSTIQSLVDQGIVGQGSTVTASTAGTGVVSKPQTSTPVTGTSAATGAATLGYVSTGSTNKVSPNFKFSVNGASTSAVSVGQNWTIEITNQAPNTPVYVIGGKTGAEDKTQIGKTDANGNFVLSGSFAASDIGSWHEQWLVGSNVIGSFGFTVSPAAASPTLLQNTGAISNKSGTQDIAAAPLVISTESLSGATVGKQYQQVVSFSGAIASANFTISQGSLPPGLTMDRGGYISGVPSAAGAASFVVRLTDANGRIAEKKYSLTVSGSTSAGNTFAQVDSTTQSVVTSMLAVDGTGKSSDGILRPGYSIELGGKNLSGAYSKYYVTIGGVDYEVKRANVTSTKITLYPDFDSTISGVASVSVKLIPTQSGVVPTVVNTPPLTYQADTQVVVGLNEAPQNTVTSDPAAKQQIQLLQNQASQLQTRLNQITASVQSNPSQTGNNISSAQLVDMQNQINDLNNTIRNLQTGQVRTLGTVDSLNANLQMPSGYSVPSGGLSMPSGSDGYNAPMDASSTTYVVKKGDTLWAISKKYYGDGRQWRTILKANTDKVKSPTTLRIGTVLVIPPASSVR